MVQNKTLPIRDHLLRLGRNLFDLGQTQRAARIFERLSSLPELPADLAAQTQYLLAEVHARTQQFRKARRHLAAALAYGPDEVEYHYMMATLIDADDDCEPRRALEHYRTALDLDPEYSQCLADYGACALKAGETREGLKALRRAGELAPDDPEVIETVVEGLRQAGKSDEAKQLLRAALFRNPRASRFRELWNRHQFELLKSQQREIREVNEAPRQGPVILPFVRPERTRRVGRKHVRRDGPSGTPEPHLPMPTRETSKKKAR